MNVRMEEWKRFEWRAEMELDGAEERERKGEDEKTKRQEKRREGARAGGIEGARRRVEFNAASIKRTKGKGMEGEHHRQLSTNVHQTAHSALVRHHAHGNNHLPAGRTTADSRCHTLCTALPLCDSAK